MVLTNTAIRQAKPRAKNYTLPDFDGLALFVTTKGSKSWHFRFSWAGKQARISFGTYPEIGLRDARALRDIARGLVVKGTDPRDQRRLERNARLVVLKASPERCFSIGVADPQSTKEGLPEELAFVVRWESKQC
ncbi:DUF4102 domain-containing protein [Pseudomonas poae]|nr:DUF4102 domain-containing protein [Pseudomonas poae]